MLLKLTIPSGALRQGPAAACTKKKTPSDKAIAGRYYVIFMPERKVMYASEVHQDVHQAQRTGMWIVLRVVVVCCVVEYLVLCCVVRYIV